MLMDLHMHEKTFSADSELSLQEIVSIARQKGLDGICITDHDSMGLRPFAQAYARQTGFPIIVGVEYYSLQGDIVAFGVDKVPQGRIEAQSFIDQVKSCGGVCFSAHPFRSNRRGLEEHLLKVRGLDGIEAMNGSTSAQANRKAMEYCRYLGVQPVGSSDCHVPEKVGVYATWVPDGVKTVEEFIAAFRLGLCYPVYYENGSYQAHPDFQPLRRKSA